MKYNCSEHLDKEYNEQKRYDCLQLLAFGVLQELQEEYFNKVSMLDGTVAW